jgi:heme oxygenase
MFSHKIREETKSAHQSLEKLMIERIKSIRDLQGYEDLLILFYGFFQPMEVLFADHLNDSILPDLFHRRKSALLLSDIQLSFLDKNLWEICTDLPEITDSREALGAMYVLEGSTLGGPYIAQMLIKHAHIPTERLGFFMGYRENTISMWQAFFNKLETYVSAHDCEEVIIEKARETFEKMHKWCIQMPVVIPL